MDTLEEELLSLSSSLSPSAPKAVGEGQGPSQDDGWFEVGKKNRTMITRTVRDFSSNDHSLNLDPAIGQVSGVSYNSHLWRQIPFNTARS